VVHKNRLVAPLYGAASRCNGIADLGIFTQKRRGLL